MHEQDLIKEKTDPVLLEMLAKDAKGVVPVIIQTVDGLKSDDRRSVETLGGKVKDDLHIIDAFSADIPLKSLSLLALNTRVKHIFYDAQVKAI